MLHLFPLDVENIRQTEIVDDALRKMEILIDGGAARVILENNYDTRFEPCTSNRKRKVIDKILKVILNSFSETELGLCIRWSDPVTCLTLAIKHNLKFVRLPVFADDVIARNGSTYKSIQANHRAQCLVADAKTQGIKIMTDIQVKHSVPLTKRTFIESMHESFRMGADAAIVTSRSGNRSPRKDLMSRMRKQLDAQWTNREFVVGGGVNHKTIHNIVLADGVIVGRALKRPSELPEYQWPLSAELVRVFHQLANESSKPR